MILLLGCFDKTLDRNGKYLILSILCFEFLVALYSSFCIVQRSLVECDSFRPLLSTGIGTGNVEQPETIKPHTHVHFVSVNIKRDWNKDTKLTWEQRKCVNIFICRLHLVVYLYLHKRSTFLLQIWLLCWITLCQWTAEKGWLMMHKSETFAARNLQECWKCSGLLQAWHTKCPLSWLLCWPYAQCLTQTAGHKIVALKVMFLWLSNVNF